MSRPVPVLQTDRQKNSKHTGLKLKHKHTDEGDRDATLWVHSFDQEISVYVRVTVCTPEK